jgi:hypothetical protein
MAALIDSNQIVIVYYRGYRIMLARRQSTGFHPGR